MAMLHLTLVANEMNKRMLRSISSRIDLAALTEDFDEYEKMAETSQQQQQQQPQEVVEPPQTNGAVDGLTEEEKSKMRPADIDADMKEMERRKRVEMMMNSRLFREELERIIETQMKDGAGPSGLLQQISEMMGYQGARFNGNVFKNSNCVVPINDIRGVESMGYAKGEKLLRCKLAAVFRLLDLYGWTQGVGGMITARLNQDQEHFLVNPYGLLYHEVTASSLVKVDMQGNVVEQGTTNFGVHVNGYQLHSTIHAARPDIKCIVHIATPSVTAISSSKCSLLPLSQESIVIGEVSNHQYLGSLEPEEKEKLARNLGPINKVLLLTNRGALCCGETIEEAFFNVYNTVLACETQLKLMPIGVDNLVLITDEARKAIYEASRKAPVPQHQQQSNVAAETSALAEKLEKRWRIGGTEFEALMRMLDNAGFRTGYIYRQPLVKTEPPRPRNDVEVPPAVSSLGFMLEEEELYKSGNWKFGRKGNDRTRWLNSPNVYQKVEILETGTPDPKKITKWVSDGSPTHSSTPVKIEGALQFVPKNTNPKEFKQLQQQIKDYRRADKISAGPQSHILEGVTWEEAKKMQDATISGTGEQVVLVGAASKGIIQRGFQHNAMVYKTPYAKNPFDQVTDQELDQYKKEVERKTKGDPYDESQSESEALSSFNISRATHESSTAKSPVQSPVSVTSETEEESRDEPKVLRIATKQVPAPSQPEVVLSDVPGGRISGVSSLNSSSHSRSHSSDDSIWSWHERGSHSNVYQNICRLERARSQELARPMRPLVLGNARSTSEIKNRILKAKFFENYEDVLRRNKSCITLRTENELNSINSTKSDLNDNRCVECDEKQDSNTNELVQQKAEIIVSDVKLDKRANVDFAERINLSVDVAVTQKEEALLSPRLVKASMKKYNSEESIFNKPRRSLTNAFSELPSDGNNNKNLSVANINPVDSTERKITYMNELKLAAKDKEVNDNRFDEEDNNDLTLVNGSDENSNEKFTENVIKIENEISPSKPTTEQNGTMNYSSTVHMFIKDEYSPDRDVTDNSKNHISETTVNVKTKPKCVNNKCQLTKLMIEDFTPSAVKSEQMMMLNNELANNKDQYVSQKTLSFNHSTPLEEDASVNVSIMTLSELEFDPEFSFSNHVNALTFEEAKAPKSIITETNKKRKKRCSKNFFEKSNQNGNSSSDDESKECKKIYTNLLPDTLELTFSDLDRSSTCPSAMSRESVFSDDELVAKRTSRRDSLVEVVNSIDTNMKPSTKLTLESLKNIEFSSKYSIDTKAISKLYCLNPAYSDLNDSQCSTNECNGLNEEKNTEQDITTSKKSNLEATIVNNKENNQYEELETYRSTDNDSEAVTIINEENDGIICGSSNEEVASESINDDEDIIWLEISKNQEEEEDDGNVAGSETSFMSNISNQGSDILEVSSETFLELKKSSDEIFHQNISSSVDEIISELKDSANEETTKPKIAMLSVPNDVTQCSELELSIYAEKIAVMKLVKNIIKDLVEDLPCFGDSALSKVSNGMSNSFKLLDPSVYVVCEIIHHVVDKDSVDTCDVKNKIIVTNKQVKETMNIELKNLKDEYDAEDEQGMKCSTPKDSLSPCRSRSNSLSEEQIESVNQNENCNINVENVVTELKNENLSPTPPSTVSPNSADREIATDTTDNDTKSDNSKEKQTDNSEPVKNPSESSSSSQSNSKISSDSSDVATNSLQEDCTVLDADVNNRVTFSVIEYNSEYNSNNNAEGFKEILDNVEEKLPESDDPGTLCKDELVKDDYSDIKHQSGHSENEDNSDSDTSIQNVMEQVFDHMWKISEANSELLYREERLNEMPVRLDSDGCNEEIQQLCQDFITELSSSYLSANEQSTSFIYDDSEIEDHESESHVQYEKVDEQAKIYCECGEVSEDEEACPCSEANTTQVILNANSRILLPPISEEPELELIENEVTYEADSFETLPAIFDEEESSVEMNTSNTELNATEGDSRATEFYSCQNSISMKSYYEEEEELDSTQSVSPEATDYNEQDYSADVSSTDNGNHLPNMHYPSDSSLSDEINDHNFNVTENYADESNTSSINNNYASYVIEGLTLSFDTRQIIDRERVCSTSVVDSNRVAVVNCPVNYEVPTSNLFAADKDNNIIYEFSTPL